MGSPEPAERAARPDPATWLDRYANVLFQYALLRVRRRELAEDLVQETFLAALKSRDRFEGGSSEKTWLVAILRRKIADHIRQAGRRQTADLSEGQAAESFSRRGKWREGPSNWPGDPAQVLQDREFWGVFEKCLSQLPAAHADAFSLRELGQLSTSDACKLLSVSPSNLAVQLHRARLALRKCLERNWFDPTRGGRPPC